MKRIFGTIILLVLVASSAFAYRPFYTEDAEIVGDKVFQNEFSIDQIEWKSEDTDTIITDIVYYGINKNIHVAAGIPYSKHKIYKGDSFKGYGDFFLVGKYIVIRDKNDMARIAIKATGKWNNGSYDKYVGFGDKEYAGILCFTQPISEKILVHAQSGYTVVTDRKNPDYKNYWLYAVGTDLTITKKGHLIAELIANKNLISTLQQQRFINVGGYYIINNYWNFDLTYRNGLTDTAQDHGFGVGLVFHY